MVTPLPPTILVQDSNGTVVRARVQNPLVSDWDPKITLPVAFAEPPAQTGFSFVTPGAGTEVTDAGTTIATATLPAGTYAAIFNVYTTPEAATFQLQTAQALDIFNGDLMLWLDGTNAYTPGDGPMFICGILVNPVEQLFTFKATSGAASPTTIYGGLALMKVA